MVNDPQTITLLIAAKPWDMSAIEKSLAECKTVEVTGRAETPEEALELFGTHRPDVAMVDLDLFDADLYELAREFKEVNPKTAVVVFSNSAEYDDVLGAVKAGVSGFFLKSEMKSGQRLLGEVLEVVTRDGAMFLAATPARVLLEIAQAQTRSARPSRYGLTRREREVLAHLVDGSTNAEIARRLGVSDNAVKHHVRSILRKLGVTSRTAAASRAREDGLIDPPSFVDDLDPTRRLGASTHAPRVQPA